MIIAPRRCRILTKVPANVQSIGEARDTRAHLRTHTTPGRELPSAPAAALLRPSCPHSGSGPTSRTRTHLVGSDRPSRRVLDEVGWLLAAKRMVLVEEELGNGHVVRDVGERRAVAVDRRYVYVARCHLEGTQTRSTSGPRKQRFILRTAAVKRRLVVRP